MGAATTAGNWGGLLIGSMALVVFGFGGYQITNRLASDMVDAVRGRVMKN